MYSMEVATAKDEVNYFGGQEDWIDFGKLASSSSFEETDDDPGYFYGGARTGSTSEGIRDSSKDCSFEECNDKNKTRWSTHRFCRNNESEQGSESCSHNCSHLVFRSDQDVVTATSEAAPDAMKSFVTTTTTASTTATTPTSGFGKASSRQVFFDYSSVVVENCRPGRGSCRYEIPNKSNPFHPEVIIKQVPCSQYEKDCNDDKELKKMSFDQERQLLIDQVLDEDSDESYDFIIEDVVSDEGELISRKITKMTDDPLDNKENNTIHNYFSWF